MANTGTRLAVAVLLFAALLISGGSPAHAAVASQLTRYPYLTDMSNAAVTVNWGTDRSSISGRLAWGPRGSCTAHSVSATRTGITVNGKSEYQWKATITGLTSNANYCYRVYLGSTTETDLLKMDGSPTFKTLPAPGSTVAPYTFAVLGDWGESFANGNPDQAALLSELVESNPRFAVFTGDVGYPAGTQTNFGDLTPGGAGVSGVFAQPFWAKVGPSIPAFAALGNHAPNSNFLTNFPETTSAAASGGRWTMEAYPSINGSAPASYPSSWFAFDVGSARFYVLDAAWDDSNLGSGTAYSDDYQAHWTQASAQYKWLAADLKAHPTGLKFAFFHYPLYSDQSTERSNTYLQGGSSLEGLLANAGVDLAFSGHAHIYERNYKQGTGSLVSYVTGGGGAQLQSIGGLGCTDNFDAYGLGWKAGTNAGGACGGASVPTSIQDVYHFLLVTVSGPKVTVRGVNEDGDVFDSTTYDFSADGNHRPSAPTDVTASLAPGAVKLTWTASSDDIGVNAYAVARNGVTVATVPAFRTQFTDHTVPGDTTVQYSITAVDGNGLRSAVAKSAPIQTGSKTTVTVTAVSDAYVQQDTPTTNYSSATSLFAVGGSAAKRTYLRFPLTALSGCSLISARLHLYVTDASIAGGTLNPVANTTWTESGLTWNNAPTVSTAVSATIGRTALATETDTSVTGLIQPGDKELDLAISSSGTDRAGYSSKETGNTTQRPQLTLECTPAG